MGGTSNNLGDDSFVEVANWGARKLWNMDKVFFHTPSKSSHPILQNNASFYKNLYFKGNYRLQKFYQLYTSDYFVSAGGSIFYKQFIKNDIKSEIIKYKNKKIRGAIGVSVGPFSSIEDENFIKNYLHSLNFITLRDQRSFELCQSFNLPYKPTLAGDLAALLPKIFKTDKIISKDSNIKKIGVNYCNYESFIGQPIENENIRLKQFTIILNGLLRHNVEINFIIFNNHPQFGDLLPIQNLISNLNPIFTNQIKIIPYSKKVENNWDNIKKMDVILCTRLHSAIFSCFSKTPFFIFEYHQKCSDFADDLGVNKSNRINLEMNDPKHYINTILDVIFHNKYSPPTNVTSVQEKAILNFTATKSFLK